MADELTKTTTQKFFVCRKCREKMTALDLGKSDDLFGLSLGTSRKAFYCNNKKCERFGDLTIAGIEVEE